MPLDPKCAICKSILKHKESGDPLKEEFEWFNGMAIYDIDKARKIVADGREVFEIETEKLAGFISYTGDPKSFNILATYINPDHLDHVADSKEDPVILGYSVPPRSEDEPKRGRMPIDGNHRIGKAVKFKQPTVHVVLLSEEETDSILTDNRPPLRKARKRKTR